MRTNKQKKQQLQVYFTPGGFIIEDQAGLPDPAETWLNQFKKDKYKALFHLGFLERSGWFSPSLGYLHHLAEMLINKIGQQADLEISREVVSVDLQNAELDHLSEDVPFVLGMEHVNDGWIKGIWEELRSVFEEEIRSFEGTVNRYFAEHNSQINVAGRVFFHLVENSDEHFPFAFMATYSTRPVNSKRAVHTPLKNALKEFKGEEPKLLRLISTVIKAAEKSDFISELLESGELFAPLGFTATEAYVFLKEIALYEEAGIMCRVPDWWRKGSNAPRLTITVGQKEPSHLGLKAIMDFSPTLKIGDQLLTEADLEDFLKMAEGLIHYKGRWVEVSRDKLKSLEQALQKVKDFTEGAVSLGEALRLQLNVNKILGIPPEEAEVSVSNGQWLKNLRKNLTQPTMLPKIGVTPSFKASLRPYQEDGYYWLNQMSELKFGACLADDMGLGKTVQMIAYLEYARIKFGGKALLILPASLIGNWQKEIERFAPLMPCQVLHRSGARPNEEIKINEDRFLYLTTYGMASRLEELKLREWDYLILDEAQAIKNPGTKQTKAIKQIPAKMRVALTGTPIENRLGDLWSLFDFLNQGLLGTAKEFTSFSRELAEHAGGYGRLRKMVQPFILRRLKTDKTIIADLPEKLEMNCYIPLTQKQVALYKRLIRQLEEKLEKAEGIERKGLILGSIMKFKQICNHPDQYLGREEFKPAQSGKFARLQEICETIREKRERVLVFTQFREITEPISDYLSGIFGRQGFVFHGGTSLKKRNEIVAHFNGEKYFPYMVLSLKAGGVGLNLTGANHIIHFDRWWNPAVENQATDRAFRIGQQKNVLVHKFVSEGTIEEKIDEILRSKQKLTHDVLSSGGEQWLTEYSNEELLKLFSLGGELA